MLLINFASLLDQSWQAVFAQQRTHDRAVEHALSLPLILGRRTISRTICALDRAQQDWSADYKLFSRSSWEASRLFDPVLEEYLSRYERGPIPIALDDSAYAKTGKKIPGTNWHRDPLSPPFHVNLRYGLRFLQASVLFPCHQQGDFAARAVPVRFEQAPVLKKPGKRATEEQRRTYNQLKKQINLSSKAIEQLLGLRLSLDEKQAQRRLLLAVLDGSFCNRTLFKAHWDRVALLARCRKDARLCKPAPAHERRRYDPIVFTPEAVRTDTSIAWQRVRIHYANRRRWIRIKVLEPVLWRRGAGTRPLRLIVIAPQPYQLFKHGRTHYREPAYLLTTDLKTALKHLVQAYFDRWQIEVNHRDEKSLLGVGQAQVWSKRSVPRHPALAVASYSLLLLSALRTFGPGRSEVFDSLPKWRKHAARYSLLDLFTVLRREINETPDLKFSKPNLAKNLVKYAYT